MADSVELAAACSERQFDVAGDVLLDALAHGLRALRRPECARWVGPVVPGATMAGGARIPGTSYELDPVRAAFCLGTLLHWPDDGDEAPPFRPQLTATLGGVLAAADYLSRRALIAAATPITVRDVLARMLDAEAARVPGPPGAGGHQGAIVRATALAVASLLGQPGTDDEFATVDRVDDTAPRAGDESSAVAAQRIGDANSRGVLLALRSGEGGAIATAPNFAAPASLRPYEPAADSLGSAARTRFETVVMLTYPTTQANKIKNLLTSRRRLEATPIDQLMALLVRN